MKKFYLIGLLITVVYAQEPKLNTIITEIQEPRENTIESFNSVYNPFVVVNVENNVSTVLAVKEELKTINLSAIINKKAFINGSWVNEGEVVEGFTVGFIGKKGIVLRRENDVRKIYIKKTYGLNLFEDKKEKNESERNKERERELKAELYKEFK